MANEEQVAILRKVYTLFIIFSSTGSSLRRACPVRAAQVLTSNRRRLAAGAEGGRRLEQIKSSILNNCPHK